MDKNCCLTLKINHKDIPVIQNDFTKINYDEYINKIDLLSAGCPCQSFSQSGKRKGLDDERGMLIFKFIEIVNLIKPKMFMIENVNGDTFKKILDKINNENTYQIYYKCLDASKYEVPQKKRKTFHNRFIEISK